MVGNIYRKHSKGRDHYSFNVMYERRNLWNFTSIDLERAKSNHFRMMVFDRTVHFIFERLKSGIDYKELESCLKILAEQLKGSWPPDILYQYFNQLFTLSGPDGTEWFCCVVFYKMMIERDIKNLEPPVIHRYEEKFAYVEERLEQDGRWRELAYVQVARDTGFRVGEMEYIEWDDIQFPRIELRMPRKTTKEPSYGLICDKTYATLQKLEKTSKKVFGRTGRRLYRDIRRYAGDDSFRLFDYRHCYVLKMMWEELLQADITKEADICEKQ